MTAPSHQAGGRRLAQGRGAGKPLQRGPRCRRTDQAAALLQQLLSLAGQQPGVLLEVARYYHFISQPDRAVAYLRRFVELEPEEAVGHLMLGQTLTLQRRFAEATAAFERGLQRAPNDAHGHRNLGLALRSQGQLDQSIDHFRRAVEIEPDFAEAHCDLGLALFRAGHLDQAMHHFRQVAQQQTAPPILLNAMARVLATHPNPALRRPARALRYAERATTLTQRQDAALMDTLAAAHAAAGQFEQAVSTAQIALKMARRNQADKLADKIRETSPLPAKPVLC